MTTFLGAPVLVRGEAWGNIYLTEKEGGEFDEADEQALLVLARWVAIAIENAHLYEDIDARRGELERAVSGLEATVAITRAVGGETDLNRVLELVVKRGRALVDARHFLVLLAEDAELVVAAAAGETGDEAVGTRFASCPDRPRRGSPQRPRRAVDARCPAACDSASGSWPTAPAWRCSCRSPSTAAGSASSSRSTASTPPRRSAPRTSG